MGSMTRAPIMNSWYCSLDYLHNSFMWTAWWRISEGGSYN